MANRLVEKATTSRGGAIAVGITVAVIAAILLIVYISRYKSSVDSTATAVPVLVAKNLIPKGTAGATVATKGRYQSTSVPTGQGRAGRDQRSERPQRPPRGLRHLSGRAADAQQLLGRGLDRTQRPDSSAGPRRHDGDRSGATAASRTSRAATTSTSTPRSPATDALVIQLFRSNVTVLQAPGAGRRQRRAQGADRRRSQRAVRLDPDDALLRHPPGIGCVEDGADARRPLDRDRHPAGCR